MRKPMNKAARRQRGVALLMTLSILALMLIMAMSFAYSSKTNRISAGISADLLQARLMCDTGLSRVLAAMKFSFATGSAQDAVYPPTWATSPFGFRQYGTSGQYYAVSEDPSAANIDTSGLPNDLLVPDLGAFLAAAIPAGTAKWQHIKQDVDRTGLPAAQWPLIGRFAYFVLDESGKVDVNAALTPDWEPFALSYDANGNGWPDAGDRYYYHDLDNNGSCNAVAEGAELRIGASLAEVVVPNAFKPNTNASLAAAFQHPSPWGDATGGMPIAPTVDRDGNGVYDCARWFSLQHLFEGAFSSVALAPLMPQPYLTYAADSHDIEAFYDATAGVDYHRFDVTGNAWDPDKTNAVNGWDELRRGAWTGLAAVQWLDSDAVEFWDTATPGQVNTVTAVPGGTGGIACASDLIADQNQRYEVLASLIDYNDTWNAADPVDPATCGDTDGDGKWDFVGLEMAPYNNEVLLQVAYTWRRWPAGNELGIFRLNAEVELVNPYDDPGAAFPPAYPPNYPTQVYVQVRATVDYGGAVPPGMSTVIVWGGTGTVPGHSYSTGNGGAAPIPLVVTSGTNGVTWDETSNPGWNPTIPLTVTEVEILTTAGAAPGGALLDYSRWTGSNGEPIDSTPNVIAPQVRSAALQTNDPRCNTRPANWAWTNPNSWQNDAGVGDIGNKNALVDFSVAGADPGENVPGNNPANACPSDDGGLSTWFVRNGPMRSLWEVGAIHRGEPWRTVSLRSFSSGDARLLSQCKVGPWTITSGKFNANSPLPLAWDRVLGNMPPSPRTLQYDDQYTDTTTGTRDIAATGATVTGAAMRLTERGQIADLAVLIEGSRDRELESTVGRLANLLTVRQNYFAVIVNGQSVKDLGANNPGGDSVCEYESGLYCRILAEQKIIATVYRDALRNRFRIERVEYLEE